MYLTGFGNYHTTEAIAGALPNNQNAPQQCAYGLYAEQLSGSAFTQARHTNLHSWLYRMVPSVVQDPYTPYKTNVLNDFANLQEPNPMRWSPLPILSSPMDFVDGLVHIAGNTQLHSFLYQCNESMFTRYFTNYDGELLFVPYVGKIALHTEFGVLTICPGMIAVIPRGVKFKVVLDEQYAAGYLCENGGRPLTLPTLGLIGANGLANPRHFLYPKAAYESFDKPVELICKYQQHTWHASMPHSPLNVVAWHGNYAPYCYDLSLFNTINTVSFDHPDPSIFTVLTSESELPGIAHLDFVIFPERWMVAEHTFRLPYYHRNVMSELMGLILGEYDAKPDGFSVGGISIHNTMTPHGPDAESFLKASRCPMKPERYSDTLAFMFESNKPWLVTEHAIQHPSRHTDYPLCWQGIKKTTNL
jgi:homogentisate 1,2-dioxygenase